MITKRYLGKIYVFFGRYSTKAKARAVAKKLRNMGKRAMVDTIDLQNYDVYIRG